MPSHVKDTDSLEIVAVGDVSMGDHPVCIGHGMRAAFTKEGRGVLAYTATLLRDSDLTIANLETVVSDAGLVHGRLESYEMRGNPATIDLLAAAGVNVAAFANNHVMQHGVAAFNDTVERLTHSSIRIVGLEGPHRRSRPFILEKGGRRHVVVGVSMRPEEWHSGPVPYALRLDIEEFLGELKELRTRYDGFIVVSVHWGLEFLDYPGPEQIAAGRAMIDAGADVVLGHHSHLLQPVERYRNGLIFYSLGNFAFDLWDDQSKLSAVARITLRDRMAPDYDMVPVVIGDHFRLRAATAEEAERIARATRYDEDRFAAIQQMSPEDYRDAYERARLRARPRKYVYFARNIHRYPLGMLLQSLGRTLVRRLTGS